MTDNKKEKGLLESVLDVAKASADEIVDRTKAVMHGVAANIGNDPQENAKDRADAAAAHARAEGHRASYQEPMKDLGAKVDGAMAQARSKAGEYAGKAKAEAQRLKTEAGRLAEQAQAGAGQAGQDMKDAADKMSRDASDAASQGPQTARETAPDVKGEVNKS